MRLIAIILSILISFASTSLSFADTNNVRTYRFENDIKMSGVISSTSKFFNVEKNWNVEYADLNLVFTKSELLDVDYSTITILINDTPIESQRLSGNKEYKKETTIKIPNDLIKEGYNEIKIKAYKTISDKVCRDDSNTANWIVVHSESNVNINYKYKQTSDLLSEYPNIYTNIDNGLKLNTTILIPDNYSSGELTAGMIIGANFGYKRKYDNFNIDFKIYSDIKDKNKNDNIIYIGKENNTPDEILNLLTDSEKSNLNDTCVIKQITSNFDNTKKRLFIISNNDNLLIKGSQLITSNDLVSNLNSNSIIIDKSTDISDLNKKESSNRIYLKDLGYENIMVKGPFSQEVIIDINTPKSKKIINGSKVKFDVRYAQNLDFERSLMTVYVNDIPIGSKKLSKEKSDNDTIEINLPKEVLGKNYYQIKVIFNLELLDLACVTRDTDNPWAYISKNSFIEFDYTDNDELSFNNYPYPFVKDNKFNDLKVIIPSNSGSNQLTEIANIITYIGRDVELNNGTLLVLKDEELKYNDKKGNLIVIGTPNNNSLIKSMNKNLNLKFNSNYNGFESDDKIKFIGDYSSRIASIQLINSPYDKSNKAMVIASTNISDLSITSKYLSDLALIRELKGDTVVIDRNGYVKDLSYNIKENIEEKDVSDRKQLNNQGKIFIIVALFLFITLTISVIFLIRKYKM